MVFVDVLEDMDEIGKVVEFIRIYKVSVICGLYIIYGRDIKCKIFFGFKRVVFNFYYFYD